MINNYEYDVAFSFAGEQRDYVRNVANHLKTLGIRVFYDEFEEEKLWGKDLYEYLDSIYRKKAKYCVMFVSKNYADKVWTSHERKSAQARALEENKEYILPARFDDVEIPGMAKTVGYISLNKYAPEGFAELIKRKIGLHIAANDSLEDAPKELLDSIWEDFENAEGEENKERTLRKSAENGDPRVKEFLRKSKPSMKYLYIARLTPIPEYIDVAVESLGNYNEASEGMEFLDSILKDSPNLIEPKHLSSVLGVARYLAESHQDEHSSFFGSLIWFIRRVGIENEKLAKTCKWILHSTLQFDLSPSNLSDILTALPFYDKSTDTHDKWRKYCLEKLEENTPFKGERNNSFFNTNASYYLESLYSLNVGKDKEKVSSEAMRFIDSMNIDELINSLKIIIKLKTKISNKKLLEIEYRLPQIKHKYTSHTTEKILNMIEDLKEK